MSQTSNVNVAGESHSGTVPAKHPNKGGSSSAEDVEGKPLTKENAEQTAAARAQNRDKASIGLSGIRQAARKDKNVRFTTLLHHVTVDLLRASYEALKRQAAPGVDGVTWQAYGTDLEGKLTKLHEQIHRGTYRAQPSRRTYIRKEDGRMRPLGIAALEDKIVQQAIVIVLNQVYEEDFVGFSYGFRPGHSQHDALDALWVGIMRKPVNWVLDCDIRGFFDNLNHEWTMKFVEHRIADPRVLRLIRKWLRAGVSEDGEWSKTEVGTPQGAVISPLLANVYLHYVLDLWTKQWRKSKAKGEVLFVRYADDFVMGFQKREEAEQYLKNLRDRLQKFGLSLHPDKTRLIEFGRYAAINRKNRGQGRPETFDFLGFTHICGRNQKTGGFYVQRKTIKKRLAAKLKVVKEELMRRRHEAFADLGAWVKAVVQGYFNYHAIPGNQAAIRTFQKQVTKHWFRALRRRSQRHCLTWKKFWRLADPWLPSVYPRVPILHPYPYVRFDAKYQR